jgi:hypothetical protein
MAKIDNTTTKIKNRGNVVESPVGTFTWTPTSDVTVKTGITEITLTDAGGFIYDINITFLAENLATYAQTYDFLITICGDYKLYTAFLNTAVGATISDSLVFLEGGYESFKEQLASDASFEVEVPNAYY